MSHCWTCLTVGHSPLSQINNINAQTLLDQRKYSRLVISKYKTNIFLLLLLVLQSNIQSWSWSCCKIQTNSAILRLNPVLYFIGLGKLFLFSICSLHFIVLNILTVVLFKHTKICTQTQSLPIVYMNVMFRFSTGNLIGKNVNLKNPFLQQFLAILIQKYL